MPLRSLLFAAPVLFAATVALTGCREEPRGAGEPSTPGIEQEAGGNPQGCVEDFEPGRDYYPDKLAFAHARQVRVAYHGHYKLVEIARPWEGAERPLRYLLVQCGTPRPEGFDGVETFEVPARSLITLSTTELPHVVGLGLVDRLLGHDEHDYVSSPEIRRRIDAGELLEVGSGPRLDVERVVAAAPELLIVDRLDPELAGLNQVRAAGVPVALAPSYLETTPLGRAEWIGYTALFFNRERRARELFESVARDYLELARRVERALAAGGRERPTVVTGGPIGDVWWVPGGESFLSNLVEAAGGRYLWADLPGTGAVPRDLESVFERAQPADVWIHPGGFASLDELRAADSRLARLEAFTRGRVFNYDARLNEHGGNDYWESGTARPDLVLADLVEIFHPELLDHELVYHRRLRVTRVQSQRKSSSTKRSQEWGDEDSPAAVDGARSRVNGHRAQMHFAGSPA